MQKEKIKKIRKSFYWKCFGFSVAYISALFLANLAVVAIGLSMGEPMFVNLVSIGSVLIILTGLRLELEGAYNQMKSEIQKAVIEDLKSGK